ncbi:MAG: nuclear transport factor 2 family protein [Actinomycetota bacterium]
MRRRLLVLALALAVPLALTGPAAAAPVERATAEQQAANLKLGTRLVNRFWSLLVAGDPDELRAFLSPAFQVQRANGSGANRNQYIAAYGKSTTVSAFVLSEIRATRTGGLVVVRYVSQTTETIDGVAYAKTPAPRISTFVQTPNGWRMASHANFNAP